MPTATAVYPTHTGGMPDEDGRVTLDVQSASRQSVDVNMRRMRVWEDWPGNQAFCRDGKIVLAHKWYGALLTLLIITISDGVYVSFVAAKLDGVWSIVSIAFGIIFGMTSIFFLLQTALTDPGILPKLPPDADYLRLEKPRMKDVVIQQQSLTLRYDETYHFYRPPRSHHCSENHVVIERFDHFCPWMGQTIGLRNHRSFLLFLCSTALLIITTITFSVLRIMQHVHRVEDSDMSLVDKIFKVSAAPIMVAICLAFGLGIMGVTSFHCYLVSIGQTTYEHIRNIPRVFGGTVFQNWHEFCCNATPPAFTDFNQSVIDAERAEPPDLIKRYNPPWCDMMS